MRIAYVMAVTGLLAAESRHEPGDHPDAQFRRRAP